MSDELPKRGQGTADNAPPNGGEGAVVPSVTGAGGDAGALAPPRVPDHELLRRIGGGSYGEVWLARNALGTFRAVKLVYRCRFEDENPFEREFKGIRKFEPISRTHEGLVDILQVGRNDGAGYFYYVMELADNGVASVASEGVNPPPGDPGLPPPAGMPEGYVPKTLRAHCRQQGRLPVPECLEIGFALTRALEHLHEHGLVHRDIKPSNIIFVEGKPKLADIGLVARADEAHSLVGTLGFIPPEGSGTPSADLFSLGKVLYEISTGKDRQEFPQLPPTLRELPDAEAIVEFNEIVLKACENDPRQRYGSAAEMRADLALLQGGRSVRRLRTVERRLVLATRAGLALAGLLVVAGGFYFTARRQAATNARLAATNAFLASTNARLATETARQLYVADMNLAFQAWDGGNVPRARALMEKHRKAELDLRGFEWRLLDHLCGESDARFTLRGHAGIVWSVAISPDGLRMATAGADGSLKVWEAGTGNLVTHLPNLTHLTGPALILHAVAFSPDGGTLASGGRDNTVLLRDAASFEVRHRLEAHQDAVRALAFSPDGRRLASGGEDGRILIWDATDGRMLDSLDETMSVDHLAWSPDGLLLAAVGTDTSVHLWDMAKREKRAVAPQRSLLKTVAFSPDGQTLAAAGYDGITEMWDVARGQSLGSIGSGAPVDTVAFSPDGQWLATAGTDTAIHVWHVRSRQRARQLRGHAAGVNSLRFSRDGAWLASASDDGTVRVWEVQPLGEPRDNLAHAGLVNAVIFAPGSARMATADTQVHAAHLWDSASGGKLVSLVGERDSIWSLACSIDGSAIFTGGVDGSMRRWDVATRQPTHTRRVHDYAVEAIAPSPDGRFIATACRGAPVKLWDAATLDAVATFPGEPLVFRTAAFSPDGRWLAAGGRGSEVLLWDVATRTLAGKLPGHTEVRAVAFSPNGATLAVADDGRTIRLWEANTRQLLTTLEGHDAPIKSISFSPDGRTLASGSEDSTVKLWNVSLRQEVATLRGHLSQVTQVAFSPDGNVLASAGGDGLVRLWRAAPDGGMAP